MWSRDNGLWEMERSWWTTRFRSFPSTSPGHCSPPRSRTSCGECGCSARHLPGELLRRRETHPVPHRWGTKLSELVVNSHVAFESDFYGDGATGWSVVAKGSARILSRGGEIAAADELPLQPWIPTIKCNYVEITVDEISARRFQFGPEPERYPVGITPSGNSDLAVEGCFVPPRPVALSCALAFSSDGRGARRPSRRASRPSVPKGFRATDATPRPPGGLLYGVLKQRMRSRPGRVRGIKLWGGAGQDATSSSRMVDGGVTRQHCRGAFGDGTHVLQLAAERRVVRRPRPQQAVGRFGREGGVGQTLLRQLHDRFERGRTDLLGCPRIPRPGAPCTSTVGGVCSTVGWGGLLDHGGGRADVGGGAPTSGG